MRRGFTLIELLIVLIVCCVLSALFFPVGHRPRPSLRRSSCQSQLKNIGIAYREYRADYDDQFPRARGNSPASPAWTRSLQPYIKSPLVFDCPEGGPLNKSNSTVTDYFYNLRLAGRPAKSLASPANTILLAEGERASEDYACWDFSRCVGQNASGPVRAVPESARTRHLDGENIAFTDGHVKWFARERQQPQPHPALGFSFALK